MPKETAVATRARTRPNAKHAAGKQRQDLKWVRHLLRHLDNSSALRTNPLLSFLWNCDGDANPDFDQHCQRAIKGIVRGAIRSVCADVGVGPNAIHGARQAEILERYDLSGQTASDVYGLLGICKRKYQYERHAALTRLGGELRARLRLIDAKNLGICECADTVFELPDEFEPQMQYVNSVTEAGLFDLAISTLRRLQVEIPDAARASACTYQLINLLWQTGKRAQAQDELRTARAKFATGDAEVRARLAMAYMTTATGHAEIIDSLNFLQHEKADISSLIESTDASRRCTAAELLHQAGHLFMQLGELHKSTALLEKARSLLDEFSTTELACGGRALLRADIISALASALAFQPGSLAIARQNNAEALLIATGHNSLIRMAIAHANEAMYQLWAGRRDKEMLRHTSLAVSFSKMVGNADERSGIGLVHARALAASGLVGEALAQVRDIGKDTELPLYYAGMASIFEGEILRFAGRPRQSLRAGENAVRIASALGIERFVGKAMRIVAEAHEVLGEQAKAIESVDPAIATLDRCGDPFSLAAAYNCSARLTGNRKHRGIASELLASISQAVAQ